MSDPKITTMCVFNRLLAITYNTNHFNTRSFIWKIISDNIILDDYVRSYLNMEIPDVIFDEYIDE